MNSKDIKDDTYTYNPNRTRAALSSHMVIDAVNKLVAENIPKIGWTELDKVLKMVKAIAAFTMF